MMLSALVLHAAALSFVLHAPFTTPARHPCAARVAAPAMVAEPAAMKLKEIKAELDELGVAAWSKCSLGSALARLLCLLRARLVALGSSALPGRGRPAGLLLGLERAASNAAHSTTFDHPGVAWKGVCFERDDLVQSLEAARARPAPAEPAPAAADVSPAAEQPAAAAAAAPTSSAGGQP